MTALGEAERSQAGLTPARTRAGLFALFWVFYLGWGILIASTGVTSLVDVVFDHDTPRIIQDLTSFQVLHGRRTHVHPLFVLFHNPIGALLYAVTHSHTLSALILNSLAGALCVVLAHVYFCRRGMRPLPALLFSMILGLSASHLLYAALPSNAIFAAVGLIAAAIMAVSRPGRMKFFALPGLYTFGVTVSCLAGPALLYMTSLPRRLGLWKRLGLTAGLAALVVAVAIPLNLLQKAIYPNARLFFVRGAFDEEQDYLARMDSFMDGVMRLGEVSEHVFFCAFIAPAPRIFASPKAHARGHDVITFQGQGLAGFDWLSISALSVWLAVLAYGGAKAAVNGAFRRPVGQGLLACVAFHLIFHIFYGDELMIYTPHATFFVLAIAATGYGPRVRWDEARDRTQLLSLFLLLALEAINNMKFLYGVYALYAR